MKNIKYYIYTLIQPIIVFPFILSLLGQLTNILFSKSFVSVSLLLAFYTLIGVGIGVLYSAKSKRKPNTLPSRYLPVLLPLFYSGLLAALAYFFAGDNSNPLMWRLYAYKNPFFFIILIATTFFRDNGLYQFAAVELTGYLGFAIGFVCYELFLKKQLSTRFSCVLSIILIGLNCISFTLSYTGWHQTYLSEQLTKNLSEIDEKSLSLIAPFKEDNGLVILDTSVSLQFTDLQSMPRLDGATAAYPVYAAFVQSVYKGLEDYYESHPLQEESFDLFVSSETFPYSIVKCSKTSAAYENLINGKCDIIFVAEPSKAQLDAIAAKGDSFKMTKIASEAFVFFNNVKNPVSHLTIKEIQDIYSGKTTNWKEVGGKNIDILPFQRPQNSGSQTIMENRVMQNIKMIAPIRETMVITMGEMVDNVAAYENSKNAIGYSFLYYTSKMVQSNQIKYISVDGIEPSKESILNGCYPFTISVYAITLQSNKSENVKRLLEWVVSVEGQELINKTGYIGIK